MTPSVEKRELRKQVLAAREALDPAARRESGARITAALLALPAFREARCVMAYAGFGSEFDTAAFLSEVLGSGRMLVLPRVERSARALRLHAVRDPATELASGIWGIREPHPALCPEVAPDKIDFALVPGVAFTTRCERLGYGGGYYDRLIPDLAGRATLAAAAYSVQVVPALPLTPSDQPVNIVVTEEAEYRRGAQSLAPR